MHGRRVATVIFTGRHNLPFLAHRHVGSGRNKLLDILSSSSTYWDFDRLCTLLPEIRQRAAENRSLEMQPCVLTYHGDIKWIRNSAYVEHEQHIFGQTSKVSLVLINNNNNNQYIRVAN